MFEIFRFGLLTFGEAAAASYQNSLSDCFETLARHPQLGRLCPAIGPNLRRHEHGSHVVFYEAEDSRIAVVAVIHRSSVPRLLDRE